LCKDLYQNHKDIEPIIFIFIYMEISKNKPMAPRMGGSFGLEKKKDTHTQILFWCRCGY
jgi:hypothetical protein